MKSVAYEDIIHSPQFKAWFGDWETAYEVARLDFSHPAWKDVSKVVDDEGKPLVVYHGTKQNFDEFKSINLFKRTKGAHGFPKDTFVFTDNSELACSYAGVVKGTCSDSEKWWCWPPEDYIGGSVIPVFLNMKNPLIITTTGQDGSYYSHERPAIKKAKSENKDGVIIKDLIDSPGTAGSWRAHTHNEYITFANNQIKSAIGNRTFNCQTNKLVMDEGGKVTNKTYEDIIHSPQFKEWFGDWQTAYKKAKRSFKEFAWNNVSKVVDKKGKPLAVFHGTNKSFTVFKYSADLGYHFGSEQQANFARVKRAYPVLKELGWLGATIPAHMDRGFIMPCFLSIKNPIRLPDFNDWNTFPLAEVMFKHKFFTRKEADHVREAKGKASNLIFRSILESKGYDGIVYKNEWEGEGDSWIAFHPNQIKLADGTNKTFDENNLDIRFDNGGLIRGKDAQMALFDNLPQFDMGIDNIIAGLREKEFSRRSEIEEKNKALTGQKEATKKLASREIKQKYIADQLSSGLREKIIAWAKDPDNDVKIIVAFSGGKDSIAMVLSLLEQGFDKSKIELWHHDIDGGGEGVYDWKGTKSYCQAFADAFGLPILYSYAQGGIVREIYRENETIQPVFFQDAPGGEFIKIMPKPMRTKDKDGNLLSPDQVGQKNTRRKFPQVTANLMTRWCSAVVKIDVLRKAVNNSPRFHNANLLILTGERRTESTARSLYLEFEPHVSSTKTRKSIIWRPIVDWTEEQVWGIMERFKVQPHPCYELGWGRCSCQLCIFSSANTWASLNEISPQKVAKIAQIEKEIGHVLYDEEEKVMTGTKNSGKPVFQKTGKKLDIYESRVNRGKSFITQSSKQRWLNEAIGEFVSPIFVDHWKLPSGAFNKENCGAN